jgi:hypothetical protein
VTRRLSHPQIHERICASTVARGSGSSCFTHQRWTSKNIKAIAEVRKTTLPGDGVIGFLCLPVHLSRGLRAEVVRRDGVQRKVSGVSWSTRGPDRSHRSHRSSSSGGSHFGATSFTSEKFERYSRMHRQRQRPASAYSGRAVLGYPWCVDHV